jgi:hypothetical protein
VTIGNRRWSFVSEFVFSASTSLFLGTGIESDADQLQAIGEGYAPFWLDENEYGYIRRVGGRGGDQEIVFGRIGETELTPFLLSADLEQLLPAEEERGRFVLTYVAAHPMDSNLLFIAMIKQASGQEGGEAYIFSVERDAPEPLLRLQVNFDVYHSFGFSPDGRYLVVTERDDSITTRPDATLVLLLHDIAKNETTPFLARQPAFVASHAYDWSADSQWLTFVLDDNLVAAVAPDERYVRPLIHGNGACTSVAWLNR